MYQSMSCAVNSRYSYSRLVYDGKLLRSIIGGYLDTT